MNALASEKFLLKVINRCVKKVIFLKYCMGFKVEMMVTLTQPGITYLNFVCQGKTLLFFVRQGKAPREILENLAGSLSHVTALLGTLGGVAM